MRHSSRKAKTRLSFLGSTRVRAARPSLFGMLIIICMACLASLARSRFSAERPGLSSAGSADGSAFGSSRPKSAAEVLCASSSGSSCFSSCGSSFVSSTYSSASLAGGVDCSLFARHCLFCPLFFFLLVDTAIIATGVEGEESESNQGDVNGIVKQSMQFTFLNGLGFPTSCLNE